MLRFWYRFRLKSFLRIIFFIFVDFLAFSTGTNCKKFQKKFFLHPFNRPPIVDQPSITVKYRFNAPNRCQLVLKGAKWYKTVMDVHGT